MTNDNNLSAQAKRRLRSIYLLSPILWAVVKGADTPEAVSGLLNKPLDKTVLGIREALFCGMVKRDLGGKLVPGYETHRRIHQQVLGRADLSTRPSHKVLRVFDSEGGPLFTQEVADRLDRSYNSTYKTLRRMADQGLVERVGRAWRRTN